MIELDRHIEILLLSNDCVIVPDLGGFMAHHIDARYEKEDGLFLPPLRTIGFNPQLTMNDSLLVQSYIEAYDISYPEALARIQDEVIEVKQNLEIKGRYEFNDIGLLSLNEEGNYVFEPCEAGILTPELYGLSSFVMPTLDQLAKNEEPTPHINIAVQHSAMQADDVNAKSEKEEKAVVLPFPELDDESENKTINIKVSLIRNLAAACIAVIAFFALSGQLGVNNSKSGTLHGKIDTSFLKHVMPKDVTNHADNAETAETTEKKAESKKATEDKNIQDKKTVNALTPKGEYFTIVLASQVSEGPAKVFINSLKGKGLAEASLLRRAGTSAKVVYGTYHTEGEARKVMNELHNKKEFADSWVLKVSAMN